MNLSYQTIYTHTDTQQTRFVACCVTGKGPIKEKNFPLIFSK